MNKKSTLFIVAARSGGHLLPGLELGKQWLHEHPGGGVFLFTTGKKLDVRIVQDYPFVTMVRCRLGNVPGKKWWRYPFFLLGLMQTTLKSLWHMWRARPDKIISTGGYLSVPVCIVAWFFHIPVELYELNVTPGRATQFLASRASKINVTFEKSKRMLGVHAKKCITVPYPLRFTQTDVSHGKSLTLKQLNEKYRSNLDEKRTTIFVLGGSQGSQFLNQLMMYVLQFYPNWLADVQIIHQTSGKHIQQLRTIYSHSSVPALVFEYEYDINMMYQAADVVVCRAGAGTLFELATLQKKALVIPLRAASTTHQVENAQEMQRAHPHLFTLLDQQSLHPRFFIDTLGRLVG